MVNMVNSVSLLLRFSQLHQDSKYGWFTAAYISSSGSTLLFLDDLNLPNLFKSVKLLLFNTIYIYLTAFGVFRRAPWKELSCKPQSALAQAQQEHCFCVSLWFLCKTCFLRRKAALCVKDDFDAKTWLLFKPRLKFKPQHVCKPGFGKGHI